MEEMRRVYPPFYVTVLISLLLLNVLHLRQGHHQLNAHLQTGSPVIQINTNTIQIPVSVTEMHD